MFSQPSTTDKQTENTDERSERTPFAQMSFLSVSFTKPIFFLSLYRAGNRPGIPDPRIIHTAVKAPLPVFQHIVRGETLCPVKRIAYGFDIQSVGGTAFFCDLNIQASYD